jgi:hypothetical protein
MGVRDVRLEDSENRVNRRELIKKTLQMSGAAYVAPMVLAAAVPLSAQGSPGPNPQCIGASCTTFIPCATNPNCVCITSSSGGGFCLDGTTSCAVIGPCGPAPGFTCPAGSFCAVDTCCGQPICAPFSASAVCQATSAPAPGRGPRPAGTGPFLGWV